MLRVATAVSAIRSARFQRLSKEGFWVVAGYGLAVMGALVGIRLLTELLDPRQYGELALGMTIAMLVNQALLGPLAQGAMRFYAPAMERQDFSGYWSATLRLVRRAAGVLFALLAAGVTVLFASGVTDWIGLLVAVFVFAVLSGCTALLGTIQSAARQRGVTALHQGLESWARFLIAAALLVVVGGGSITAMWGYAVAALLVLASQYWFFRRLMPSGKRQDPAGSWERQIWAYSWPIAVFGAFTWAQGISDRWALQLSAGPHEVGLYAVLFQLGYYPILILAGMGVQMLAPIYFQRAGDAQDARRTAEVARLTWRLAALVLAFTAAGFVVALALHGEIFRILVSTEYASVSFLLPWVLLGGGLVAASQAIALGLLSQIRTYEMMPAKVATALFGVACNFAGAYWYGIAGVAAAGVLFGLACLVWMAVLLRRRS